MNLIIDVMTFQRTEVGYKFLQKPWFLTLSNFLAFERIEV